MPSARSRRPASARLVDWVRDATPRQWVKRVVVAAGAGLLVLIVLFALAYATMSLPDEPPQVQEAVLTINTDATNLSLQVALLVPLLAGLLGLFDSFRMMRLPDVEPSASADAAVMA